ncbi:MAG: PAS domain S-box protein [Syntrophotaleaceae bacterium]
MALIEKKSIIQGAAGSVSDQKKKEADSAQDGDEKQDEPCFVVGIGASAGGLDPLEKFFSALPQDIRLALVVAMPLPPEGPPLLADIVRHYTSMDVFTAEDLAPLLPNTVHIIPPDLHLKLKEGRLRVNRPSKISAAGHLPIDHLFSILAEEFGSRTIGVVLSGFGNDGVKGVKSIRERGGIVLVQDPETAVNPVMPQNVIATRFVDKVLPVEEIARKIGEIADNQADFTLPCRAEAQEQDLREVFTSVRLQTGHDFAPYKRSTVLRRLDRRMRVHGCQELEKYCDLLKQDAEEARALAREMLIGVTRFFRDPDAFEVLEKDVIPLLFADRDPADPVRVWHPCCSTGEEAYSVAILMREHLQQKGLANRVQIFATDIDEEAVAQGRSGLYHENIGPDVGPGRLETFFINQGGRLKVVKDLRDNILFAPQSLIKDPPFSRLDLLVCRNFLIYLNADMQKDLIALFHLALKPGGFLFLGASESVGPNSEFFTPLNKKWKIYQRKEIAPRQNAGLFPFWAPGLKSPLGTGRRQPAEVPAPSPAALAEKILLDRYSPPCVVINGKYEVLHITSPSRRYLEVPVGKPTRDILKMAREELRPALRAGIYKAFAEGTKVDFRGVRLAEEGGEAGVNIIVEPLPPHPVEGKLALVVLEPAPGPVAAPSPAADADFSRESLILQLEEQLRITDEQLQVTRVQLESSNDGFLETNNELLSINEEFQSANEELQSTNEELEASKEELQALNEEMVTVNAELHAKVEELDQMNSDMENLFTSSGIATIFLDRDLLIKRFSPAMAGLLNLIPADIGRPFRHMGGDIDWSLLQDDARKVLETLVPTEREVTTRGNLRHFLMRVLPYRTSEGALDGIVFTLVDITDRKCVEEKVRSVALFPEENPFPVMRVSKNGILRYANRSASELLTWWRCGPGDPVPDFVQVELVAAIENNSRREIEIESGTKIFSFSLVPIQEKGYVNLYASDVTKRKRAEAELRSSEERLRLFIRHAPVALAMFDREMRYLAASRRWRQDYNLGTLNLVGVSHYEVFPDIGEDWKEAHRRGLAGEVVQCKADLFRTVEGSCQWIRWEVRPWTDTNGAIGGIVIFTEDITERRQAEKALAESEARYRELVQNANSAILRWRSDGTLTFFNEYAQQLFGWSAEEALGRPVGIIVPDEETTGADLKGLVQDIVAHPERYRENINQNVCRDGRRVWMSWTNRAIRAEDGEVQEILAIGSDITQRKQAEDALREREEQFRVAFEQSSVAMVQVDPSSGRYLKVNEAFCRFLGYSEEELLQKTFGDVTHAGHCEESSTKHRALVRGEIDSFQTEKLYLRRDGTTVWGHLTVNLVNDSQGNPLCALAVIQDIDARRKAEEDLRHSQRLLAEAESLSHTGAWEWNVIDDRWTFSDEWLTIHGCLNPLIAVEALLAIAHPEDRAAVARAFEETLKGLAPYDLVHRIVRQNDGFVRTVHASGRFVQDSSGKVVKVYGFAQDITERRQAEEALKESEQRYRSFFQNNHAVMLLIDPESGAIVSANPAACDFYGHSLKKIICMNIAEINAEAKDQVQGKMQMAKTALRRHFIFKHRLADGQIRDVEVFSGPIPLEGRELLYSIVHDITDRKQAEESLQRNYQLLDLLETTASRLLTTDEPQEIVEALCRKVMTFLDCQTFFNFLVDEVSDRMYLNAYAGIPAEEAKKIEFLDYGVAVCGCAARDACRIVAEDIPNTPDPRTDLVHSFGIQAYACHPLMAQGRVLGTLSFGTRTRSRFTEEELALMKAVADQVAIAMERKRAREELQAAHADLETKVRERTAQLREKDQLLLQQNRQAAMGEMINNIAHQWRQPLNGLGLIVQALPMMLESGGLDRKALEDLGDKAMQIIHHMSQTIDDFRNYFKPEKEKMWFPASMAVHKTIRLIEEAFRNLNIIVDVEETGDPMIFGYPNEFGQVLLNVLINARDAFRERKVKNPKIRVCLGTENDRTVIIIADNAGGIAEDILEKVFDPYFTTKGPEHGTGIGLFMSKTIIEKNMGGRIYARNAAEGAEFRIEV